MAIQKSAILVDAGINLTGISNDSIKKVKNMIKENILTDNKLKLELDKNGESALLKKLDVVYDRVNDIKKIAATVDIGGTQYKVFIDDMSNKKKDILKLNRQITMQEKEIAEIKSKGSKKTSEEAQKIKDMTSSLNSLKKSRQNLASGLLVDTSLPESTKYKAANLKTSELIKTTGSSKSNTDAQKLNALYKEQARLITSIAKAESQYATNAASNMRLELKQNEDSISLLEKKIGLENTEAAAKAIKDTAKKNLGSSQSDVDVTGEASAYKKRISALNNYKRTLKEIENQERSLAYANETYYSSVKNQTSEAKQSLAAKKAEIATNRKLANEYLEETKIRSKNDTDSAKNTNEYNKALEAQAQHLNKVSASQSEAKAAFAKSNNMLGILSENFKSAAGRIIDYTLVYRSLWAVMHKVSQAIQTITELNKAFTDIQMVTGYTDNEIKALEQTYSGLAKSMGATVSEVAKGATEWLRQGKSVADTNELLKQSMILSKTGAIDSAKATERLTSTLNGYKLSVADASKVVDVFSKLDMITASSVDELSVAFTKTANSAKDAGIPFENLAGLIATVSETTRKSATTIGESYKTLAARYMNVKLGKFVDDETGEAINDTEKVLNKLGIQLRTSENEWRDMWDVMNEIGTKWNSFNQMQKNAIVVA